MKGFRVRVSSSLLELTWRYDTSFRRTPSMVCSLAPFDGAPGLSTDVDRDVAGPDGSVAPLAERLVDSHTGPSTAASRAERREAILRGPGEARPR